MEPSNALTATSHCLGYSDGHSPQVMWEPSLGCPGGVEGGIVAESVAVFGYDVG
jgi:hypothetical protein